MSPACASLVSDALLVILGLLMSTLTRILSGFAPALSASRLDQGFDRRISPNLEQYQSPLAEVLSRQPSKGSLLVIDRRGHLVNT
jgi:hypothetical protein